MSPHPLSLQPPQPRILLNPQIQPPHPGTSSQTQNQAVFTQNQVQNQNKSRPLLLEEQPLLLQDLLDQERQEQQQQKQMQALIRQRSTSDSLFPNMGKTWTQTDPNTSPATPCKDLNSFRPFTDLNPDLCDVLTLMRPVVFLCLQQTLTPSLTPS